MFQFTQPKRAATCSSSGNKRTRSFNSRSPSGLRPKRTFLASVNQCFNSRSPSGLRLAIARNIAEQLTVSIHAAQTGCDFNKHGFCYSYRRFNSRSPSGLRRSDFGKSMQGVIVSIHAAQAGCDFCASCIIL